MVQVTTARKGILLGLTAAVTFGVSAPLSKRLLDDVTPQLLAGLLYIGAFVALSLARGSTRESKLQRADAARLSAMILAGGVLAPVLLLLGLQRVEGVTGSLLLNLEGPFTIVLGVVVFREHLPRRSAVGAVVIFAGAVLLTVGGEVQLDVLGIAFVAAACLAWALDNNLTQSLTVRDPRSLVWIKAGVAGATNTALAFCLGASVPDASILLAALALGGLSYGISVYLDALALRALGAAREAAIFAVAPFAGALLAPFVLPESLGIRHLVAGAAMAIGIAVLLRENHAHAHQHEPFTHEHLHHHDDHHRHDHGPDGTPDEPHSHRHDHDVLVHAHPHVSDAHHRHDHN